MEDGLYPFMSLCLSVFLSFVNQSPVVVCNDNEFMTVKELHRSVSLFLTEACRFLKSRFDNIIVSVLQYLI